MFNNNRKSKIMIFTLLLALGLAIDMTFNAYIKSSSSASGPLLLSTNIERSLAGFKDSESQDWKSFPSLNQARRGHRVTSWADGRIFVSGGLIGNGNIVLPHKYLSTAEFYDPSLGKWVIIETNVSRFRHTSTSLPSGAVLIAGGQNSLGFLKTTEIYDPKTNRIKFGPSLLRERRLHAATMLTNGRILITGGYNSSNLSDTTLSQLSESEEIDTESFKSFPVKAMNQPRELHTASLLSDGRVLVTGGIYQGITLAHSEIYDPRKGSWEVIRPMKTGRSRHTATLLKDGRILIIGGSDGKALNIRTVWGIATQRYASCEIYNPKTGEWTMTDSMKVGRATFMDAILLSNNKVLVGGGLGEAGNTWEIFDVANEKWEAIGFWKDSIYAHRMAYIPSSNQVVKIGGLINEKDSNRCQVLDIEKLMKTRGGKF